MPESKIRKKDSGSSAGSSAKSRSGSKGNPEAASKAAAKADAKHKRKKIRSKRWVAPTMLTCWLLGIAWIVVYYIAGQHIGLMVKLGNWNLLVGMGLIAVGFVVSTQWE